MALPEDYDLHRQVQLRALEDLSGGVPAGLPDQFAELSPIVGDYATASATIEADANLTEAGKRHALTAAREKATAAIATWKAGRAAGVTSQMASAEHALEQAAATGTPPTETQVRDMVDQLSPLDPLEIAVLYSDATEPERLVMEAAIAQKGRVARRRADGQVVWETLLPAERLAEVQAARRERADPAVAATVRDLNRIRNAYESMASAAVSLLR